MKKRTKLRLALNKQFQRGVLIGEGNYVNLLSVQSKNHRVNLADKSKEHEKQIENLNKAHRREISLIEKEYAIKTNLLEKRVNRVGNLINEWENKVVRIRKMNATTHEICSKVKHAHYQSRKEMGNILDEEKTMDSLEAKLADELRKTTLAKSKVSSVLDELDEG